MPDNDTHPHEQFTVIEPGRFGQSLDDGLAPASLEERRPPMLLCRRIARHRRRVVLRLEQFVCSDQQPVQAVEIERTSGRFDDDLLGRAVAGETDKEPAWIKFDPCSVERLVGETLHGPAQITLAFPHKA